jgi:hypothetical protein
LVAAALAFEPFQHVGIYALGKRLLDGQVLLAALCAVFRLSTVFICSKICAFSALTYRSKAMTTEQHVDFFKSVHERPPVEIKNLKCPSHGR